MASPPRRSVQRGGGALLSPRRHQSAMAIVGPIIGTAQEADHARIDAVKDASPPPRDRLRANRTPTSAQRASGAAPREARHQNSVPSQLATATPRQKPQPPDLALARLTQPLEA